MTELEPLHRCARCGLSLGVSAFTIDRRHDHPRSWCKPCALAATTAWRHRHKAALAERRRVRYAAARLAGATVAEAKRAKDRAPAAPDPIRR